MSIRRQSKLLWVALLLLCSFGCQPAKVDKVHKVPLAPMPPKHCHPQCKPEVIVFSATWCGPCQRAKPIVEWLRTKNVIVLEYDIDQWQWVAQRYGITAVPTFILGSLRTHDIKEVIAALGMEEEFTKAFGPL